MFDQLWETSSSLLILFYSFVIQLAPSDLDDADRGFPGVRWSQSYGYGYVPNFELQSFFMAVAMDTPDVGGPHGS